MRDLMKCIAEIAAMNDGVVDLETLVGLGASPSQILELRRKSFLWPMHEGVFAVGHPALSQRGRWRAAVLASGRDAELSHVSAAQLYGVTRRTTSEIHVVTTSQLSNVAGITRHERSKPRRAHSFRGIRVSRMAHLIVDLGAAFKSRELQKTIDEAAYRGLLDEHELRRQIAEGRGLRGIVTARDAYDEWRFGSCGTDSALEDRVAEFVAARLPDEPMQTNHHVGVRDGVVRADMWFPRLRIVGETDGIGHLRPTARRRDAERRRKLAAVDVPVYRVWGGDFDDDPWTATMPLVDAVRAAAARIDDRSKTMRTVT